ncbi:MAG: hypothetical protein H7X77_04840 [Anaerolineae bacterium]|nr:hypothetical protein [Anaerolineae bacterium]
MSASIDAMIKDGVRLYKAGKKAEARAIWEKVTELDQYSEQAWLWLSAVVETPDDQRTCLENVLFINPENANAKKGLETLNAKSSPPSAPPASSPAPVKASPSKPVAPPETSASYDPPTATSSASSVFVPDETPPEIYDDWIGSLNLGGSKPGTPSNAPFAATPAFDDAAFADDAFDNFSFEEDNDEDHPAQQIRAFMDKPSTTDDNYADDFDDPFSDDPFADSSLTSGPFSAAALSDDDEPVGRRPITSASRPASQPARRETPPSRKAPAAGNTSRSFIGDNIQPLDEPDPAEYFAMIPASIKATRLPGTDERHPTLIRILLYLLILLNLGAVGFLAMQLMG